MDSKGININDIKYIKGPETITEMYNEKTGQRIYMFGDYHAKLSKCVNEAIDIQTFIKNILLENQTKIFDVFVEYLYHKNDIDIEYKESYLTDVFKEFKSCLYVDKKMCKYKNLRMHYSDIRKYPYNDDIKTIIFIYQMFEYFSNILDLLSKNINEYRKIYSQEVSRIKSVLKNMEIDMKEPITLSRLVNNSKAKKNLDKDSPLKNIINKFIENNNKVIHWNDIMSTLDLTPKDSVHFKNKIISISNTFTELFVNMTDIYLICRVFKKSLDTKNIIIYMGQVHIDTYEQILLSLSFKKINYSGSTDIKNKKFQCLDISKFQPFKFT